jgi:hypothetical protein
VCPMGVLSFQSVAAGENLVQISMPSH